jgi:hypothetical protein
MITYSDIIKIALDLKLNPSIKEMNEVLKNFMAATLDDPSATWDLIVENLLYNFIKHEN